MSGIQNLMGLNPFGAPTNRAVASSLPSIIGLTGSDFSSITGLVAPKEDQLFQELFGNSVGSDPLEGVIPNTPFQAMETLPGILPGTTLQPDLVPRVPPIMSASEGFGGLNTPVPSPVPSQSMPMHSGNTLPGLIEPQWFSMNPNGGPLSPEPPMDPMRGLPAMPPVSLAPTLSVMPSMNLRFPVSFQAPIQSFNPSSQTAPFSRFPNLVQQQSTSVQAPLLFRFEDLALGFFQAFIRLFSR